ncbi:MAG: 3-deoxy-manno-octulosonate cytidylyltransferase [Maricaulaceae bacterium]
MENRSKSSSKPAALVIIPARMASTRLPGKPLADIAGDPMIVHVMRRAQEAAIGPVIVACAEEEIKRAVEAAGGTAVLTDPALPSGTDRVKQAADKIDPSGEYDYVINVQGDMPTVDPNLLTDILDGLLEGADIATAAVETEDADEIANPNVVKAVLAQDGRALYFTRAAAPHGEGSVWHHLGVYAYRRAALNRFCALPPSPLELRERLEQLRALEAGMHIHVAKVETAPHGVDTPEDLRRAREILGHYNA